MSGDWIVPLNSDEATLSTAGGKGLNLARLARAGFPVPGGFLLTTGAYRRYVEANRLLPVIERALSTVEEDDPASLEAASQKIRRAFEQAAIPPELAKCLRKAYRDLQGEREAAASSGAAVAVRSSATAEDLPDLSFAGQQDTFLNVVGEERLLEATVACWSSLWTARAIGYRRRNQIAHDDIALAVIVQRMVPGEASGVLFTANPLNGKRSQIVIDATIGLGEALVSGQVDPDHYVVDAQTGQILESRVGPKAVAVRARPGGGTTVERSTSSNPAIPESVVVALADLGQQIAALYGRPQDVEWAWSQGELYVLQSRSITSLYPLPDRIQPPPDGPLQVFISFGAVQGVLEPMTPLGRDTLRAGFAGAAGLFGYELSMETQRVLYEAGERLFVNVTTLVRHPVGRSLLRRGLTFVEPGAARALETVWEDPRLAPSPNWFRLRTARRVLRALGPLLLRLLRTLHGPHAGRRRAQARLDQILQDFQERDRRAESLQDRLALLETLAADAFSTIGPHILPTVAAGLVSLSVVNRLASQVGDSSLALELTRGVEHNVTSEMDLALWATAQQIRAHGAAAQIVTEKEAGTLAADYLAGRLPPPAQTAVDTFMDAYGMRGTGEIDLGRPRWRNDPTPIMHTLKSYLQIDDPALAPDAVFGNGAARAEAAIEEMARSLRSTRFGGLKERLLRGAARRVRALVGLRESPKFLVVRLLGLVHQGLLQSGRELVAAGTLLQPEDVFFLHLRELRALARGQQKDWAGLVARRRRRHAREQKRRQIPRLMLSNGHAFYEGVADRAAGDDAVLSGSPVSPGVVEGPVRVVFDPQGAQLAHGEILVCPGTDPAWTPLFLAAGGLVMEVGGLMTHGSVVAREYGIPAVVGVHEATARLRSGQRVRVDGTAGSVEILDEQETLRK